MTAAVTVYTVQEAAAKLGVRCRWLFAELRRRGILGQTNLPCGLFRNRGLIKVGHSVWEHPRLGARLRARPLITEQGLIWIAGNILGTLTAGAARGQRQEGTDHD